MGNLTLCMPSKRPLEMAAAAIESAVAFCEQRDCLLVIADNSGDVRKRLFCSKLSERVVYIESTETTAIANLLFALRAAQTSFVMPIADDDVISAADTSDFLDLGTLSNDVAGVVPVIELRGDDGSILAIKGCAFDDPTPSDRLKGYLEQAKGDNSAYYSIYRRTSFLKAIALINDHHPTGGGYTDWAIALSQLASGKMLHDSSIRYSYTLGRWSTPALAEQAMVDLYREAGLPPEAARWNRLFVYLDLYVLVSSSVVHLPEDEKQILLARLSSGLLLDFVSRVASDKRGFNDECLYLCEMIAEESDSLIRFQMALMLVDRLHPGLKDRYIAFFRAAIAMP